MALNTNRIRNPEMKKWADEHLNRCALLVNFGTPVAADDDLIVTSANMKVGTYTIAAQPDVCRNISITHTAVGAADTLGTITLVGTDYDGYAISETVTPLSGTVAYSTKAFKTITSATGAGWVIGEGNDTVKIGVGPKLGMPFDMTSANAYVGIVGTALVAPTVTAGGTKEKSLIDLSSGTYNGSKRVVAFVIE